MLGGFRKPLKLFSIVPPDLVAGANVTGNNSSVVTTSGENFIAELINLLNSGSVKLFGDAEEIPFSTTIWPMVDLDTPQNEFQFIGDELDWGDFTAVDFDFDGYVDAGRSIEDGVPFYLYNGVDGSVEVDFGPVWNQVMRGLSSEHSYGELLFNEDLRPTTAFGCFALIVGLARTKRDWIYGMNAIGINPLNINGPDAVENFQEAFAHPLMQQAGTLNLQGLRSYIDIIWQETSDDGSVTFDGVVGRYARIAEDSWLNTTALDFARTYYHSRVAGIDLSSFEDNITSLSSLITGLQGLLDAEGNLTADVASARSYLSRLRSSLSATPRQIGALNNSFGLISDDLSLANGELGELLAGLDWLPATADEGQNLGRIVSRLEDILAMLDSMSSGYSEIMADSNSLIDALFNEFTAPLDSEPFSDEFSAAIRGAFGDAFSDSLGYVTSIMAVNRSFSIMNKINARRYEKQKEHELNEKISEARAESRQEAKGHKKEKKINSLIKAEEKRALSRMRRRKSMDAAHYNKRKPSGISQKRRRV